MSLNVTKSQPSGQATSCRVGPPLSSDGRAGAHSRRRLRSEQREWLWRNRQIVAATAILGVVGVVLAHVLLPERFGPYIVGAIAASCGWWIYVLMLELGGMARLRAGVTAEEWTSSALRGLHSKGWRTANHIRSGGGLLAALEWSTLPPPTRQAVARAHAWAALARETPGSAARCAVQDRVRTRRLYL